MSDMTVLLAASVPLIISFIGVIFSYGRLVTRVTNLEHKIDQWNGKLEGFGERISALEAIIEKRR